MRSIWALVRAAWLTALSYRMGMLFSLGGLVATFVPVYFVSGALQPIVAESIRHEGGDYFGFLVIGMVAMTFVLSAVSSLPSRLSGTLNAGTLEAMMATPTTTPTLLVGLVGYEFLWAGLRASLLLVAGAALGMTVAWTRLPAAGLVLGLLVLAYFAAGLLGGALVILFRTTGPLVPGVITVSTLLGGVYYSTSVIPSWIHTVSQVVPLTYGLRAVRRLLLEGATLEGVASDVLILSAFAGGLLLFGAAGLAAALRHARRAGSLAQY